MNLSDQHELLRWLLSTTSQSSAALVAIIGGFVLSRVLSVSSQRSSLIKEKTDLRSQQDSYEADFDSLRNEVVLKATALFKEEYLEDFIAARGEVPQFDKPISQLGLDAAQIQELASKIAGEVKNYCRLLEDFCPRLEDLPREFEDLVSGPLAAVSDKEMLLRISNSVYKERNSLMPKDPIFGGLTIDFPEVPLFSPFRSNELGQLQKMVSRLNDLESRIHNNLVLLGYLNRQIEDSKRLPGLLPAITLLSLFGLVGIAGPMVISLIPFESPVLVGWIVVGVFGLFFVAFVSYLVLEAYRLKEIKVEKK